LAALHQPAEIETVKALLIEGLLTRAEIGKQLGLTVGAVAGMAHRMKAGGVVLPPTRTGPRVRARPIRKRRKRRARLKPPKSTPVTLLEISKRGCHWPVSGEGLATMFCNASRRNSGHVSYCKFHAMKSINPGKSRRDRGGALI
jgi:hypothetical protein